MLAIRDAEIGSSILVSHPTKVVVKMDDRKNIFKKITIK